MKSAPVHLPVWTDSSAPRPRVRADCEALPRPCPFPDCRYHLAPESRGAPFVYSCALDAADDGPHTLEEVATILGLSWDEVRDLEVAALQKLRAAVLGERHSTGASEAA